MVFWESVVGGEDLRFQISDLRLGPEQIASALEILNLKFEILNPHGLTQTAS